MITCNYVYTQSLSRLIAIARGAVTLSSFLLRASSISTCVLCFCINKPLKIK